ncbi:MAG: CotH kinase family protein [Balneolia bacterium]|nr:CotH kinase family protein [Balneolia bacterium]
MMRLTAHLLLLSLFVFTTTAKGQEAPALYNQPPEFSLQPGFYDDAIELEILHPLLGSDFTIHFTTDGSVPNRNSAVYEEAITLENRTSEENHLSSIRTNPPEADNFNYRWEEPNGLVDKATVVRAVVFNPFSETYSPVLTGTYFVGIETSVLPIVSFSLDEEHFFDHETGIYIPGREYEENGFGNPPWGTHANYFMRGEEWERPAHLELFENNAKVYETGLGLRIHGAGSRAAPMKSLRLYFRSDYGDSGMFYPIFGENNDADFNRLILRSSGQDFYLRSTMFRDAFMQRLAEGLNVTTQDYRPAVVFINGEYWGIHNFRERFDRHFFERVFSVAEGELDYLEGNSEIQEGDNTSHIELMEFIRLNDLSTDENYAYVISQFDKGNLLDYFITQIYIRNTDWPGNNLDYWRFSGEPDSIVPEKDGRWRYLLFDTDYGFGHNTNGGTYQHNTLEFATLPDGTGWPNPEWSTRVLRKLLENDDFKTKFIARFSDLMNTAFTPDRAIGLIYEMSAVIAPEIQRHSDRWQKLASVAQWEVHLEAMREFAIQRPDFQRQHLQEFFELGELIEAEVNISAPFSGVIALNTILLDETEGTTFPWSGMYFSGQTMELEAKSMPGYEFSHWVIDNEEYDETSLTITLDEDLTILAVFEASEDWGDVFPLPHPVAESSFEFTSWAPDSEPGSFPESMAFVYMDRKEPRAGAAIAGYTSGAYNLDSRTRINGLGHEGFSFINTGNEEGNPGYPGVRLGGAILAIDTREVENPVVTWEAGTILPNSRIYNLRLEYRIGNSGTFKPLENEAGEPIIYSGNQEEGHLQVFPQISLPQDIAGRPYVQLLWRYYYSGTRLSEDSGDRSQLRVGSVTVSEGPPLSEPPEPIDIPETIELFQNYPNPFNAQTVITFNLPESQQVVLRVYDVQGRLISTLLDGSRSAGTHRITFDANALSSGVYLYTLETASTRLTRKLLLLK